MAMIINTENQNFSDDYQSLDKTLPFYKSV